MRYRLAHAITPACGHLELHNAFFQCRKRLYFLHMTNTPVQRGFQAGGHAGCPNLVDKLEFQGLRFVRVGAFAYLAP